LVPKQQFSFAFAKAVAARESARKNPENEKSKQRRALSRDAEKADDVVWDVDSSHGLHKQPVNAWRRRIRSRLTQALRRAR
jgi:hypothetical protein